DNLKAWLQVCRRSAETCCDVKRTENPIRRLAEKAGIVWKHNALRHSFISYRVALTQNIPQVALEAGNSVKLVNSNYRALVTPDEAKAWFAILPKTAENIVPMAANA